MNHFGPQDKKVEPLSKLGGVAEAGPPKAHDFSALGKPNDRTPRSFERTTVENPAPDCKPADNGPEGDWRDIFYLNAFLNLTLSEGKIQPRERVWIKRFLANRGKPNLYSRMEEIIREGHCNECELHHLVDRASAELSMSEKRRFIYNLAQLFQSKGSLSTSEYASILDLAEKIGVPDTEADTMIHSVYRVNDSFIAIMGLLALGMIIYLTRSVIIPLVISIFITMIINRIDSLIVSALRLKYLRWFTKVAAMVVILGAMFGLVMAAISSGTDIANRFPEYESRFNTALHHSQAVQSAISWLDEKGVLAQLKQLPDDFLSSLVSLLTNFVLVAIFTGFLVFSSSAFTGVLADMNKKIGTYISIKSLISLITGLAVFLLCWAFGIDFALFWALLAFLLNYIPSVGSIVASLPPILLAMIQLDSWIGVVFFAVSITLMNVLLGQVLEPKLMGRQLAIKPMAILLGLIFWGLLWGIPGMFLATPLMALIGILASYFNFSRSFERLLSTDTT